MTPPTEPSDEPSSRRRRSDFDDPVTLRVITACDAMGDLVEYWGFKKAQGRVWTYLVLAGEPRHQIEIAEAFGISKALVSATVAELMERNLVRATEDKRSAPVEATLDVWPTIAEILRAREWRLLENARVALEDVRAELEWQDRADRAFSVEHVARVLSIIEVVQGLLRAVMSLRRPQPELEAEGDQGGWMRRASRLIGQLRRRQAR